MWLRRTDWRRRGVLVFVQSQQKKVFFGSALQCVMVWHRCCELVVQARVKMLCRLSQHAEGWMCDRRRCLLPPVVLWRCLLLLFLQETVYLEPVRAPSVPGTTLGHPHFHTFPQTARLARCPVLLVDDALPVILALRNGAGVVVWPSEERL
jgi:hypothetical protein